MSAYLQTNSLNYSFFLKVSLDSRKFSFIVNCIIVYKDFLFVVYFVVSRGFL